MATFLFFFLLYSKYKLQMWCCVKNYILIHYSLVEYDVKAERMMSR